MAHSAATFCRACCIGLVLAAAPAAAQNFPVKPIRIVVPYSPGGGTDTSARLIGRKLQEAWNQQVIVDNRPGAFGMIGADLVAKAPPDGHTLMIVVAAHTINPSLFSKIPFDTAKDFAAVTLVNSSPVILITHPSVPARNARELIALAKARPGQLSFGSSEANTHLSGEFFAQLAGIKWEHIPFKGGADVLVALAGGHLPVGFSSPQTATPHYKSGKVRVIGNGGRRRIEAMPDVPVIAESGLPGYEHNIWYGMFAPGATPKEILAKIQQEIARIVQQPDVKERLAALGTEPVANTPDEFAAMVREELAKWPKVVATAGIKPQ